MREYDNFLTACETYKDKLDEFLEILKTYLKADSVTSVFTDEAETPYYKGYYLAKGDYQVGTVGINKLFGKYGIEVKVNQGIYDNDIHKIRTTDVTQLTEWLYKLAVTDNKIVISWSYTNPDNHSESDKLYHELIIKRDIDGSYSWYEDYNADSRYGFNTASEALNDVLCGEFGLTNLDGFEMDITEKEVKEFFKESIEHLISSLISINEELE